MSRSLFIRACGKPAICESSAGRRATATCVWVSFLAPGDALAESATLVAARCPPAPGRVHALGDFTDSALHSRLELQLPPRRGLRLRQRFEWYACRGAGFHNDAHYGGVLFGAWCVAGPPREIVFPRIAARASAAVGELAVFDPFEPHAVLEPGKQRYSRQDFEGAAPSVFIGFEVELDAAARAVFGIGAVPIEGSVLSSAVPINAETGALPGPR